MLRRSFWKALRLGTSLVVALGTMVTLGALAMAADEPTPPPLRWKLRRAEDRIEARYAEEAARLSIQSPSGIGQAVFERTGSAWPAKVVLQLHLRGLESLRITAGDSVLGAAVGVTEGRMTQRSWRGASEEQELADDDPWRVKVRAVDAQGRPATKLPLEDGLLEVELPQAVLRENPGAITLEWIDFYRQ
jgi:hypothetical protein